MTGKTQNTQENGMSAAEKRIKYLEHELVRQWGLYLEQEERMLVYQNKVRFADMVAASEGSIGVQEMAHLLYQSGIDIGETRLYQWLRGKGYVYRQPCGQNMPSQKGLESGIVELQKQVQMTADGRSSVVRKLMVTPKGQRYLLYVFHELKADSVS